MPETMPNPYQQPALSLDQQIDLLASRGLSVPDRAKARHYLQFIGYTRLIGYAQPFQQGGDGQDRQQFHPGTTFDAILDLYIFDRKLRLLAMDAIERIEVALRAAISNRMSIAHGPHWFMEVGSFQDAASHRAFLQLARRETGAGRHPHIERYRRLYDAPDLPPSWIIVELLSFGQVSRVYASLYLGARKEIARMFGLHHTVAASWLHALSYARNLCAHHALLWNRRFTISPMVARRYREHLEPNHTFYAQAVVMQIFLRVIAEDSEWSERLSALMAEHPHVSPSKMGFPSHWRTLPLWSGR